MIFNLYIKHLDSPTAKISGFMSVDELNAYLLQLHKRYEVIGFVEHHPNSFVCVVKDKAIMGEKSLEKLNESINKLPLSPLSRFTLSRNVVCNRIRPDDLEHLYRIKQKFVDYFSSININNRLILNLHYVSNFSENGIDVVYNDLKEHGVSELNDNGMVYDLSKVFITVSYIDELDLSGDELYMVYEECLDTLSSFYHVFYEELSNMELLKEKDSSTTGYLN